ncbi:MAG TPA: ABC transporter permease [Pyrinomonadaceae bacterium]|jgi:predicted permease|nr:ABC transporter permease [Pyrinomonadaceae bacterium]
MRTLLKDLRFGVRALWKSPGFTLVAVASLALGIGANTAIFSLVNTVLLRPLPAREPSRLVSVSVLGKDDTMLAFSYPTYKDYRERSGDALSGIFAERLGPMSLSRDGNNQRVWGYLVTGNYFEVLGVSAAQGRAFTAEDDRAPLASPVAVLSHGSWVRRFGADPSVVGKDIMLNGHPFRVVGVMPEGFVGAEVVYTPEVWVPMMMQEWIEPGNAWLERRTTQNIFSVGRLKDGVTREQAEASLNMLAKRLGEEYPDTDEGQRIALVPPGFIVPQLRGAVVGFAAVLMAAVALVLLIACVNLANLLLARASSRRKEIAIRLAMGASRWRVVRQLLTESLLLSLAGGVLGLLLAMWILDLVAAYRPPIDVPLWIDVNVDGRVMAFTLAASVLTALLFGLMPALQSARADLVPALKDAGAVAGRTRTRLRSALVVAQVMLSLVVLVAAGLVVRALGRLQTVSPGFEVEHGLVASFDLGLQNYDEARGQDFERRLIERVRALPGVRAASLTDLMPLSLNYSSNDIHIEGQQLGRGANAPISMVASVERDYFNAMSIPLVAGRAFTEADKEDATRVVIVNETLARRFFPGEDPAQGAIGRRISFQSDTGPWLEIAGVARDGKYWTLGEAPQLFVYSPLSQAYSQTATLVVRSEGDPRSLASSIRAEVARLDPALPLFDVKTMDEHMGVSLFPARVAASLLGGFGLLALLLAAMGVYGVVSYSVAQRTREIGIRLALGARARDVLGLVAGRSMALVGAGLAAGLAVALMLTHFMEGVLYGVSATDAVTFTLVVLTLAAVALLACLVPARRATKVDPMVALRHE